MHKKVQKTTKKHQKAPKSIKKHLSGKKKLFYDKIL